jgi:putative endonuclease
MWTVYILRCGDGTLYTGIARDVTARLASHTQGSGAKYTRGRGPFTVVFSEMHATKGEALKRERQIKTLSRIKKLALCN